MSIPQLRVATLGDIPALAEAMVNAANFSIPGRNLGDELYNLEKDIEEPVGERPPGKIWMQFEGYMQRQNVWLAEIEGSVAGAVVWRSPGWDALGYTPGEILSLFVHPKFHGRGIGASLLRHAKQHVSDDPDHSRVARGDVLIEVRCFEKNPRSLRFYEREGFVRRVGADEWLEEVREYLALLVWFGDGSK